MFNSGILKGTKIRMSTGRLKKVENMNIMLVLKTEKYIRQSYIV